MLTYTFLTASLIIVLIPGTGVIYTLSNGILKGIRPSIFAAIGCTLGILPHLVLSILCLSIFNGINEIFLSIVKILGSVYLFYLGIIMFRQHNLDFSDTRDPKNSLLKISLKGATINILNPKLTIFFLAFLPQFVNNSLYNTTIHSIVLGLVFMLITLVIFIIYGILASSVLKILNKNSKTLQLTYKIFGIAFIFLAIRLGLSHI